MPSIDVVVIGAGQAGLSAGFYLRHHGVDSVILDRGAAAGGAWAHRWPTLRMRDVHGLHPLPGSQLPDADPAAPARDVVPAYFARYEQRCALPVRRPVVVRAVRQGPRGRLIVEEEQGGDVWAARAVINATGTWEQPFWPHYPGVRTFHGEQLHAADYPGPDPFAGRHVTVVGGGTSALAVVGELVDVAASTTWVTRRPPRWRTRPFTAQEGRLAVARVAAAARAGQPLPSIVTATGLTPLPAVTQALADGRLTHRLMFERVTTDALLWPGGERVYADVIIWATGFRPALAHLAPLHLHEPGGGIRMTGAELTQVARLPQLHLVGYGPSASTVGATRAARAAVAEVRELLGLRGVGSAAPIAAPRQEAV